MKFLRKHWFDVGAALAVLIMGTLLVFGIRMDSLQFLLWGSLISLFLHQFEEYRYPGYFPGMMNVVMFNSKQPDRFPLNEQSSVVVNVFMGWGSYALAAVVGEKALWLAIATILVSVGNTIAHTLIFNIRGKTLYNPGLATALLLFLPISLYFFYLITHNNLVTPMDWVLGIVLGVALNYIGILKTIDWMADAKTAYIFPKRCLIPENNSSSTHQ
jgi:hypothetical protein